MSVLCTLYIQCSLFTQTREIAAADYDYVYQGDYEYVYQG